MRGGDKLLERVDGQPQIARVVAAAVATGLPVLVALDPARPARISALEGLAFQSVPVPDAASGMAASLRRGLAVAPPGAVLVHLADLPDIGTEDLNRMITEHHVTPDLILRATDDSGRPGHPVLFPGWARPALADITGDRGARDLLQAEAGRQRSVALPGLRATTDLDTPEDWAEWRAARQRQ